MKFVFVAPRLHTNQYEIVKTLQKKGHSVKYHVFLHALIEDHSLLFPQKFNPCIVSRVLIKFLEPKKAIPYKSFPNPFKYYKWNSGFS
jgi:hypothetical protein